MLAARVRLHNMGAYRTRIRAALAVAAIGQVLSAQPTPEIPRVEILGASVSAGYKDLRLGKDGEPNDTVPLLRALRHIWPNVCSNCSIRRTVDLLDTDEPNRTSKTARANPQR